MLPLPMNFLPSAWIYLITVHLLGECWSGTGYHHGSALHFSLGIVGQPWLVTGSQFPFHYRVAGSCLSLAGSVLGSYFQAVFDFLLTSSNEAYLKMPGSPYSS